MNTSPPNQSTCDLSTGTAPIVVFSDDWAQHPSSTQHIITQMLPHRQVIWVNTIATRLPSLNFRDLKKASRKILQWLKPTPALTASTNTPNPITLNPVMYPTIRKSWQRRLNTKLITQTVNRAIERYCDQQPIALTTIPITADLIGRLNVSGWVYHVVDDFAAWPGLDHQPLQQMHTQQLQHVDRVAVVSDYLANQSRQFGRTDTTKITHGVDPEIWQTTTLKLKTHPVIDQLKSMRKPVVLFWGLIDNRLDFQALRELSAQWHGEIALVGPTANGIENKLNIKALRTLGPIAQHLLPQIAQLADVLIMPYGHSPVTAAMQPLKLMEYLSTPKPVICTNIPATADYTDCCDVVHPTQFAQRVIERHEQGIPESQRITRRKTMRNQTWHSKASQLNQLFNEITNRYTALRSAA